MKISSCKQIGLSIFKDANRVMMTLLKIMLPIVIIVGVLEYYGFSHYLGELIAPFLKFIGLPPEAGIITAATISTHIYAGVAVFSSMQDSLHWTHAQLTILGTLMLLMHNLPLEVRIAQRSGCRVWLILLLRVGGGVLLCWALNLIFQYFQILQGPGNIYLPKYEDSSVVIFLAETMTIILPFYGLNHWFATQLATYLQIYIIVLSLIAIIRWLRHIGAEHFIGILLTPFFRLLKLDKKAMPIIIVGFMLGMTYGGGLLIQEAESGRVGKDDVFTSICFLSLCHSYLEDTLLVLLIGAHYSGVIVARTVFALLLVYVLVFIKQKVSEKFIRDFLVIDVSKNEPLID